MASALAASGCFGSAASGWAASTSSEAGAAVEVVGAVSGSPEVTVAPWSPPPASPAPEPSPMSASSAPTSTVSSSSTRIFSTTPATGEGTSVSTLSVDTSSSGSSTSTDSPTALSHRVTVPSVTDSPSAGIFTDSDMSWGLLRSGQL